MPAPILDGFATGTRSGANQVSATLTTTQTNDIICALVHFELNNTLLYGTGVSGGGLTWNFRARVSGGLPGNIASFRQSLELWWAVAPSALAAQSITLTTNASFDDASMVVFGVNGCNTTNPWDANPSLPAKQFSTQATSFAPTAAAVSTTNANDFLIFAVATGSASSPGTTPPTSFTMIANATNGGGTNNSFLSAAYRGVTSVQSNQTITWGASPTNNGLVTIMDALTADSGGMATAPATDLEYCYFTDQNAAPTVTVTTFSPTANDVLLLYCYSENATSQAITGVSGGGLTWTRRALSHGSVYGRAEVWSAQASGQMANTTVTVTYAASTNGCTIAALALSGATATIFDSNASLPANASNPAASTWTPSATVSTAQAHDIVLAFACVNGSATTPAALNSPPAGFRTASVNINGLGAHFEYCALAMQRRSTALSGGALTWGAVLTDFSAAQTGGEYIVDAITADTAAAGGTTAQARAMILA